MNAAFGGRKDEEMGKRRKGDPKPTVIVWIDIPPAVQALCCKRCAEKLAEVELKVEVFKKRENKPEPAEWDISARVEMSRQKKLFVPDVLKKAVGALSEAGLTVTLNATVPGATSQAVAASPSEPSAETAASATPKTRRPRAKKIVGTTADGQAITEAGPGQVETETPQPAAESEAKL